MLILFGKLFNGSRKSLDLLSQGCGILVGLHLNIEVDGNYVFESEYENVIPYRWRQTDEVQIRQSKWVRPNGAKMSPSWLQKWQVSFLRMATGVVLATMSLMPKSV